MSGAGLKDVDAVSALSEVLEILFHYCLQRRRGREAEGGGAGSVHGHWPVVHDALDAWVVGIGDGTRLEAEFIGEFAQD